MKFSRVSRDFFFSLVIVGCVQTSSLPQKKNREKRRFFSRFFSERGGRLYKGYSNRGRKAFG